MIFITFCEKHNTKNLLKLNFLEILLIFNKLSCNTQPSLSTKNPLL